MLTKLRNYALSGHLYFFTKNYICWYPQFQEALHYIIHQIWGWRSRHFLLTGNEDLNRSTRSSMLSAVEDPKPINAFSICGSANHTVWLLSNSNFSFGTIHDATPLPKKSVEKCFLQNESGSCNWAMSFVSEKCFPTALYFLIK